METIKDLIRPCIAALNPYSCARNDFEGVADVFLDANENPWGNLNRYPDSSQKLLKKMLESKIGISAENIFIGNGSDEVIDLTYRIFCEPGKDKAIIFPPTYGMYQVYGDINNVNVIKINLLPNFQIDLDAVLNTISDSNIKLIIVCSPNNPTGNVMDASSIKTICEKFKGIVLIDEAYAEFSNNSMLELLNQFSNVIISRTFSKARALASARVGIAYASTEIISLFNRVKPPYNVSGLNQQAAINALLNDSEFNQRLMLIKDQKSMLIEKLKQFQFVVTIFPSDANFLLVQVLNADNLYKFLMENGIIVRNRSTQVENCVRITVGTPTENEKLLEVLTQYKLQ